MAKYEIKTRIEPVGAQEFIAQIENPQRRAEASALLEIYAKASGFEPRIYTGGMIGFGSYSYETAGCRGSIFATGFAARKADLSLYGLKGSAEAAALLPRLGKIREGAGCVYAKRLSDLDHDVLARLITLGLQHLRSRHEVTASS